jgi:hypothetical protein
MRNGAPWNGAPPGTDTDVQGDLPRDRLKTSLLDRSPAQLQALKTIRRGLRGVASRSIFSTRCPLCRRWIRPGYLILPVQPGPAARAWLHLNCAARWHASRAMARGAV